MRNIWSGYILYLIRIDNLESENSQLEKMLNVKKKTHWRWWWGWWERIKNGIKRIHDNFHLAFDVYREENCKKVSVKWNGKNAMIKQITNASDDFSSA